MEVKRIERGWAGHFICAERCKFRRNTLLKYKKTMIVISTVGLMSNIDESGFDIIGANRYFETMAFHSNQEDKRYYDIDVSREIFFESDWAIGEIDADDKANDMHEKVVDEITDRLIKGELFLT